MADAARRGPLRGHARRRAGRVVALPSPRTDIDAAAVRADHGDRYDRHSTVRVLRLHGRYQP